MAVLATGLSQLRVLRQLTSALTVLVWVCQQHRDCYSDSGTAADGDSPASGLMAVLAGAEAVEVLRQLASAHGGAGVGYANSTEIAPATTDGTAAGGDAASGLIAVLAGAQSNLGVRLIKLKVMLTAKGLEDNSPFGTKSAISAEISSLRSVNLDAPYSSVTVALSDGYEATFETYADLLSGSECCSE